jgi:hypothetical protein
MDDSFFEDRYSNILSRVGTSPKDDLLAGATLLQQQFPTRAPVYFLLNLVRTLYNLNGGGWSDQMFTAALRCPDYTPTVGGDIQRDRAIGLIRYRLGRGRNELVVAARLLHEVQLLHNGDANRMACWIGVRGRLAFTAYEFRTASAHHQGADTNWGYLADSNKPYDAGWRYTNLVHWLCAVVADQGRKSHAAQNLARRIREQCPEGTRSRADQAQLLLKPWGLRAFRYAETHPRV